MKSFRDFLKEQKITASALRKKITDVLSSMGYKVTEREDTAGAKKAWLDGPSKDRHTEVSFKKLADDLQKKLPGLKSNFVPARTTYSIMKIEGDGFEIEPQGNGTIFLAVYKGGSAGMEYSMGIDT